MVDLSETITKAAGDNFARLRGRLANEWRPVDPPPICDWLEENLRFGPGDRGVRLESRVGPFTFADSPWWRFPLRCAVHPRCRSLAMPAATQVHKTVSLLFGVALYLAEFRPGPGMFVVPDELEAKKVRDRIYLIVQESRKFKKFRRLTCPREHKWNLQEIDLGSMAIHLAWAGSRQRTRGKPCYYVWFTELDVYRASDPKAGDPVEAGKQRTKDVFAYKHFFESSPSEWPSTVCDEESLQDARWRWHFECPHCRRKQEARFFQHKQGPFAGRGGIELTRKAMNIIGGDGAELMEPAQARQHAYYVCESGCKITDPQKQFVIEGGDWYPFGFDPDKDPEPIREPSERVGFHLWGIHSPSETFGTLAEDYLRHVKKGIKRDFYGNRLALSYRPQTRVPNWKTLGERAAGKNLRGTVPDWVWFLTSGIDKQGDANGSRYTVRGWAPGKTSCHIDWGWITRYPELEKNGIHSDLLEVENQVLRRRFAIVDEDGRPATNPLGKSDLAVRLGNIDTNHLPMQIHRWMRTLPEEWVDRFLAGMNDLEHLLPGRVRNIRGDHKVSPDVRFRHSLVENNSRGEQYEGGLHLWGVCVYPFYSDLTDCLAGHPGGLGSWWLTADVLAKGREYLEQVTNFAYRVEYDPKKGKRGVWAPKNGRIPVDYWDCEIYATAAAEMVVGDIGWNEHDWNQWLQGKTQASPPRIETTKPPTDIGAR